MVQHIPEAWINVNLTISQLKSLFFISQEGSSNFSELASALKVTPPNVTGIVNRLVEQGLVSREENPENRRMHILKLTNEGKTLVAGLWESRISQLAPFLTELTTEDLSAIARGFTVLARAVETKKPGPAPAFKQGKGNHHEKD